MAVDGCLLKKPKLTLELEQVKILLQLLTEVSFFNVNLGMYSAQSAGTHPGKSSDKFRFGELAEF